jgi:hypothetical protein
VVVSIYTAITSNLPWATRLQSIAQATATAATDVAVNTSSIVQAADTVVAAVTQKELYPFQKGTPQFLERLNNLMLSDHGLLYHLTGMDYDSMIQYLKQDTPVDLPTTISDDDQLKTLPLVRIGTHYWDNIKIFIQDSITKGVMKLEEIQAFVSTFNIPKTWSAIDSLAYILWQQAFHHNVIVQAAQDTWDTIGSYITSDDKATCHEGTQKVVDAFRDFYSLKSTSLVDTASKVESPSLARKFISLNQLLKNDPTLAGFEFLSPDRVSMSLV